MLAIAIGAGLFDDDPASVAASPIAPTSADPPASPASRSTLPLRPGSFDPGKIYAERSGGVVTVYAQFGDATSADAAGGQGSGFVVSDDGYVLTNAHVVTDAGGGNRGSAVTAADDVYVEFSDGDRVGARVIGWDIFDDVAVIKVDPEQHELQPVPLGDSTSVRVGDPVAAIGSPFGEEGTLTVGVVSATRRSIEALTSDYAIVDAIQTDAPINRGNSGGPMFNARGEVIGINAQIRSESGNAEGVGFAVPINAAKRSMRQLIESGRVRYAWLGVTTQTVTPRLARHFGFEAEQGAAIQSVVEGSPAEKAGLQGGGPEREFEGITFRPGGDLVVAIDGAPVAAAEDVVRAITQELLPGQRVRLTVLRGNRRLDVAVVLGERPAAPPETGR